MNKYEEIKTNLVKCGEKFAEVTGDVDFGNRVIHAFEKYSWSLGNDLRGKRGFVEREFAHLAGKLKAHTHMLQVTRHTSHVTRHMLHVTRHTSHVTCYMSHVTRHTLHAIHHTSHVTRHTSHATPHTPAEATRS